MKASDDLSRTPTLLDITGMNISDRDLTAQSRELIQVFADLKSREDKAAVLGYAKRLLAFTAQCCGGQHADGGSMKERVNAKIVICK
jgi:hypothetical protein